MTRSPAAQQEVDPSKNEREENFPVGSWLIQRRLRPHVLTFYRFARAADDIADSPRLAPDEKVRRLEAMEHSLLNRPGYMRIPVVSDLKDSFEERGLNLDLGVRLLSAFKQDATKTRYLNWAELMDYCDRSAAPVGRFLLDLHGEDPAGYPASDALCNALQVINHLQDCQQDYRALNRVYLPLDWMAEASMTAEDLARPSATPAVRQVLARCVSATAALVEAAKPLPALLKSRRLAAESRAIVEVADRLIAKLAGADPLANRIELSRSEKLACMSAGLKRLFGAG
jgi:hydroxysqualene synthase